MEQEKKPRRVLLKKDTLTFKTVLQAICQAGEGTPEDKVGKYVANVFLKKISKSLV